mgnify:CR=1 FL=1
MTPGPANPVAQVRAQVAATSSGEVSAASGGMSTL